MKLSMSDSVLDLYCIVNWRAMCCTPRSGKFCLDLAYPNLIVNRSISGAISVSNTFKVSYPDVKLQRSMSTSYFCFQALQSVFVVVTCALVLHMPLLQFSFF